MSGIPTLRCRVSSSVEELQLLHEVYAWVPGAEHIRPTPEVRAQKETFLLNLDSMWASQIDFVHHHIFGAPATRRPDGRRASARPTAGASVFKPNHFPYQLPAGTEHHVLWMASPPGEWSDELITATIATAVDEQGGGEFVWYPNPKPSLPDPEARTSHVQVFWRRQQPQPPQPPQPQPQPAASSACSPAAAAAAARAEAGSSVNAQRGAEAAPSIADAEVSAALGALLEQVARVDGTQDAQARDAEYDRLAQMLAVATARAGPGTPGGSSGHASGGHGAGR